MSKLIPAKLAAIALGCNEVTLSEIAHSRRLPRVVATATGTIWIAESDIEAYRMAIAEKDDR